jgi:hypothetical protein
MGSGVANIFHASSECKKDMNTLRTEGTANAVELPYAAEWYNYNFFS